MSLSDELEKLGNLRRSGMLTDEEFANAKARVISEYSLGSAGSDRASGEAHRTAGSPDPALAAINGLRRSRGDRWIGGVCGGLATMSGLASWIWRLLFAAFALCAGGGVLIYILLWIFVPEDRPPVIVAQGPMSAA